MDEKSRPKVPPPPMISRQTTNKVYCAAIPLLLLPEKVSFELGFET